MLRLENVPGPQLGPYLDAVGELRITVFREFPYLYEGSIEYEREYLRMYAECPRSMTVLAFHGHAVVGMSTCLPMDDAEDAFNAAFKSQGQDTARICYLGESVLLQQYRGRGVGKQFFSRREAHARDLGHSVAAFCAVDREAGHPLRPKDYVPLTKFWTGLGYACQPEIQAAFPWKEVHETGETVKTLTFWTKDLD